jgi:hypothetical protein
MGGQMRRPALAGKKEIISRRFHNELQFEQAWIFKSRRFGGRYTNNTGMRGAVKKGIRWEIYGKTERCYYIL